MRWASIRNATDAVAVARFALANEHIRLAAQPLLAFASFSLFSDPHEIRLQRFFGGYNAADGGLLRHRGNEPVSFIVAAQELFSGVGRAGTLVGLSAHQKQMAVFRLYVQHVVLQGAVAV